MEDRSKQIEDLEKRRKNLVIQKICSIIIITILFFVATYYFGFIKNNPATELEIPRVL